jgi:DNA-directed RNA polymerase specialized sigma24 family protein
MKKSWVLSQESFDALLKWLSPNRDEAGRIYEEIRLRLIRIFTARSCSEAEDLADETMNRVASKLPEIGGRYSGDPALYFSAVANNVHLEFLRRKPLAHIPVVVDDSADMEDRFRCLEECLGALSAENRDLVIQYYHDERQAKIDHRKLLARRLGIVPNALRIRACRIRASLLKCVEKCLKKKID